MFAVLTRNLVTSVVMDIISKKVCASKHVLKEQFRSVVGISESIANLYHNVKHAEKIQIHIAVLVILHIRIAPSVQIATICLMAFAYCHAQMATSRMGRVTLTDSVWKK